jgi:hypothetical protein
MTPDHARENHGMPAELPKLSPLFSQRVACRSACCAWNGHANIAAANRHHARDPQRTLKLLQTA